MQQVSIETKQALDKGLVRLFVTLDFEFSPVHVHNGEGMIELEGRKFNGLGDELMCESKPTNFSRGKHIQGTSRITLPKSKSIEKVLQQKTYMNRGVTCEVFAIDKTGNPLERVWRDDGKMLRHIESDDSIALIAIDDTFDNQHQKDKRHYEKIAEIRNRFNRQTGKLLWKILLRFAVSLFSEVLSLVKIIFSFFGSLWSNRILIRQRLSAKRRVYWIETEPEIPGKTKSDHGYKLRADTLEEAIRKLHSEIRKKIWLFPRGCRMIIIRPHGYHTQILSLEDIRLQDDPKRCKESDPIQLWLRNNKG